jgi:dihydroorotate dehydrogenase (fumarate)
MDLSTRYLGMNLRSPLVPSASPLSDDIDNIKKMEDAGAGAIVLHSLFEEQLIQDQESLEHHLSFGAESFAEALTYFPMPQEFRAGPEEYLNHVRKAKESVRIPVIASLNGASIGGWIDHAKKIQQAGADALELNIYSISTDLDRSCNEIEQTYLDIVLAVRAAISIPVAVKMSPFFSNLANMARRLDGAGVNGLVLFNRFYQPDINLETLEIKPSVNLSTPQSLRLPMRWIAILYGKLKANLAATSGIHTALDAIKMLMVGADVTMLCSVLLQKGIGQIKNIETELCEWLEEHDYQDLRQLQGSMSQKYCSDPAAFERAQYMKAIISYKA